mgnify:CR=1 FL=1
MKKEVTLALSNPTKTSAVVVHHILGVKALYSRSYNFAIDDIQVTAGNAVFSLSATTNTSFTVQSLTFDALSANFTYGFRQINWQAGNGLHKEYLWMEFAPVIYTLVGFSRLEFSGMSLNLDTSIDTASNIVSTNGSLGVKNAVTMIFSLGLPPSEVCSPCNNYISLNSCDYKCAADTYAYTFGSGGNTCKGCPSELGQSLKIDSSGCDCQNGMIFFEGNCFETSKLPPNCTENQLLVNDKCVNKDQILKCPANSIPNENKDGCICIDSC